MKLVKFLFTAFTDKEGATRASGTLIASVTACWFLFVTNIEYHDQIANRDAQMKLLWHQLHQTQDILAAHGIYVPREDNINTNTP